MTQSVKRKRNVAAAWIVTFLLGMAILLLLGRLMMPKYMSAIPEGALISEYYQEPLPHQVLFVGDCEVYENFSPVTLWENYGITSYIRGSAQQLIWQSYYLLEEMLDRETPQVVVFNVLSVKYGEPQNEAYNRMSLDGMRWSGAKWRAVRASLTEDEQTITYLFPFLRYHSRWKELSGEDFRYLFRRDRVGHSGYLMQTGIRPLETMPPVMPLEEPEIPDVCMTYLAKMADLCQAHGAELILIKAPTVYPHWYDEWDAQIQDFARERELCYYNFLESTAGIGLDWLTDTYDSGLHLNVWGAEKLTDYFGDILTKHHGLVSLWDNETVRQVWESKAAAYHTEYEQKTGGRSE